jgi:hypothetical protein
MRTVIKIILIIVTLIVWAVIGGILRNAPNYGGLLFIVSLVACLAAIRAIWKYNPDKGSDITDLDKS